MFIHSIHIYIYLCDRLISKLKSFVQHINTEINTYINSNKYNKKINIIQ